MCPESPNLDYNSDESLFYLCNMPESKPAVYSSSPTSQWLISLLVLTLSITITLALWSSLRKNELDNYQRTLQDRTHLVKNDIQLFVQFYINSLQRMAQRWEVDGGTRQDKWTVDARNFIAKQQGLRAVQWVDSSYHVRWIEPLAGNEQALGLNIVFDDKRPESGCR